MDESGVVVASEVAANSVHWPIALVSLGSAFIAMALVPGLERSVLELRASVRSAIDAGG